MNHQELDEKCKAVVARFRAYSKADDVYQTAYLSALEQYHKDPDSSDSLIDRVITRAVHEYLNFGQLPVTVPKNSVTRQVIAGGKVDKKALSEKAQTQIKVITENTLSGGNVVIDEVQDSFYDDKNGLDKVFEDSNLEYVKEVLSEEDFELLMDYYGDTPLTEVAEKWCCTRQGLHYKRGKIIQELRKKLQV